MPTELGSMLRRLFALYCGILLITTSSAHSLEREGVQFKVFQFPADQIPRIDGDIADWDMVPANCVVGSEQLSDAVKGHGAKLDPKDLDVRVRVGWVKGLNRL